MALLVAVANRPLADVLPSEAEDDLLRSGAQIAVCVVIPADARIVDKWARAACSLPPSVERWRHDLWLTGNALEIARAHGRRVGPDPAGGV